MTTGSRSVRTFYPALTEHSRAEVAQRLVELVCLRHEEGLDPAQLAEVRASVDAQLDATETLHQFTLTNADEPAFTLPADLESAR